MPQVFGSSADSDDASRSDSNSDSSSSSRCPHPHLAERKARINSTIRALGGCATPKLNWSAPTDATWISPSGLACHNADEVLLLLKSSERVADDLQTLERMQRSASVSNGAGGSAGNVATLALRKWHRLQQEREFRCFVKRGHLVAVSQRDVTQHSATVVADKGRLLGAIEGFFATSIQNNCDVSDCALPATPSSVANIL
jgi:D123